MRYDERYPHLTDELAATAERAAAAYAERFGVSHAIGPGSGDPGPIVTVSWAGSQPPNLARALVVHGMTVEHPVRLSR